MVGLSGKKRREKRQGPNQEVLTLVHSAVGRAGLPRLGCMARGVGSVMQGTESHQGPSSFKFAWAPKLSIGVQSHIEI